MSVARRIDPVESTAAFIKEVKEGTRPNGQKVKITGDQINRIVRMYNEGYASAGLKIVLIHLVCKMFTWLERLALEERITKMEGLLMPQ